MSQTQREQKMETQPHGDGNRTRAAQAFSLLKGILLLLGLGVLLLWLRLMNIDRMSLWLDEGFTWGYSHFDLSNLLGLLRVDVHPPLYFILCHYVLEVVPSVVVLRYLSVCFSVLTFALVLRSMLHMLRPAEVVLMGILFVLSPMQIHFSQEVRMYTMLGCFAFGTLHFAIVYGETFKKLHVVFFVIFASLSLYTHYYGLIFVIGMIVYIFWIRYDRLGGVSGNLAFVCVLGFLIFLLYLPWFQTFLYHVAVTGFGGYYASWGRGLSSLLLEMMFHPLLGLIPFNPLRGAGIATVLVVEVFSLLFYGLVVFGAFKCRKHPFLWKVFICGLCIPLALTFIHILLSGRFFTRCLIVYLPLLFLFASRGISSIKNRVVAGGILLIVVLFFAGSSLQYLNRDLRDVSRVAFEYLAKEIERSDELVLHVNQTSFMPFWAYGTSSSGVMSKIRQQMVLSSGIGVMDRTINGGDNIFSVWSTDLRQFPVVWFVTSRWGGNVETLSLEYQRRIFPEGWKKVKERKFISWGGKQCIVTKFVQKKTPQP